MSYTKSKYRIGLRGIFLKSEVLQFEYSESDVLYTQLSIFQKFMKRHSLDKMTALQLFKENEVFEILSDCYESVQLDGDGEILNDIDALLRNNGVTIE